MKNTLLTLLALLLALTSFGQFDNAHRVLNYVPDNCSSLRIVDFKQFAQDLELPQVVADKVLEPLEKAMDELKGMNALLNSWVQNDGKMGIDFSSVAAVLSSDVAGYDLLIPISNSKRFEAVVKKIAYEKFSCATVKGDAGTYRLMIASNLGILITSDVAFIRADETLITREGMENAFNKMHHSHFFEKPTAKIWLENKMDSYTGAASAEQMRQYRQLLSAAGIYLQNDLSELNRMVCLSKTTVGKEALRFNFEMLDENGKPFNLETIGLEYVPDGIQELLPYQVDNPIATACFNADNLGKMLQKTFTQDNSWYSLLSLLNHPVLFSMSAEGEMLSVTRIDQPEEIGLSLQRFVDKHNASLTARYSDKSEPDGKLFLTHKRHDDYETYLIIQNKMDIDYETFEFLPKEDSTLLVVKDGLLFLIDKPSQMDQIIHPQQRELPAKMDSEQLFFANVDLSTLGYNTDMPPIQSISVSFKGNIGSSEVNAYPDLQHGLFYALMQYAANLVEALKFRY